MYAFEYGFSIFTHVWLYIYTHILYIYTRTGMVGFSEVDDDSQLTAVDKAIMNWYMRAPRRFGGRVLGV